MFKEVIFAVIFGACIAFSSAVQAAPAAYTQSVVIETEGIGLAPQGMNTAQGMAMARRAAMADLIKNAVVDCGGKTGRIQRIYSESFEGGRYLIRADVQVLA